MMKLQMAIDDLTQFTEMALDKLPSIFIGLIVFITFFWLSKPIANLITKPLIKTSSNRLIQRVIHRTMSLLIILLGLYILLSLVGLTQFAVALLSGTGVIGLIVGFAFKDIAENFLSSLLLSIQRPFKLGDIIEVSGYLGVVKKMTSRATTLVDFNGDHIQLPNATIYKNAIRNLTANPNIRAFFDIGIGYETDFDHAQSLVENIMNQHPAILEEPAPQVLVNSLGSSSCNLRVYFWVNSEINSQLKVSSVLMKKVVAVFLEENITMPDDARERIILSASVEEGQSFKQHNNHLPNNTSDKMNNNAAKKFDDYSDDDVSSDHNDIREQAAKARDPEEGENILSN